MVSATHAPPLVWGARSWRSSAGPVTLTHALTHALKLMGVCTFRAPEPMSALDVALIGATGLYVLFNDYI